MSSTQSAAVPPHDLGAERAVISAVLLRGDLWPEVSPLLEPADCYEPAHRAILGAVCELDRASEPVDAATVASRLHAAGRLEGVGGTAYLARCCDETAAIGHALDHARRVAYAARVRGVLALAGELRAEGWDAMADPEAWLRGVEARVLARTETARVEETISVLADALQTEHTALAERSRGTRMTGHATRVGPLDRILGGLSPGCVYLLGGRPGHGKTALAWQIAEGVARSGHAVAFASLEMPRSQLVQRALAQTANIAVDDIRAGRIGGTQWDEIATAVRTLEALPIAIDDRAGQTVHDIRSSVRRCVRRIRRRGMAHPLGLVVIDYAQLIASERHRGDSRDAELADTSRRIAALAKEFDAAVLLLSQLNREIERRPDKRPKLSDLRESGALEADAYAVAFCYREDCYRDQKDHDRLLEIIVAKNRNGRLGSARMRFDDSTRCTELADQFDGDFDDPTARRYE